MDQTEILGLKAHELMSIGTGRYIRKIKTMGLKVGLVYTTI